MELTRNLLLLLALFIPLAACAGSPSSSAESPSAQDDRRELITKIEEFNLSIREGNKQMYGDVFVEDFVFTWSRNGQVYDRAMILPNVVPTPEYRPLVDELIVRIYGDSAIVNYRVRKKEEDTGVRVTFSYARIAGAWKVMASHSTKIVVAEEESEEENADTDTESSDS